MSDTSGVEPASLADALVHLETAVAELCSAPLTALGEDELLDAVQRIETAARRAQVADHRLVGDLDRRGTAAAHACRTTATLLALALRLSPGEARARVRAAQRFTPRVAVSGAELEPEFTQIAAALPAGELSPRHAEVIADALDRLPTAIRAEVGDIVETQLLNHAATVDARSLAVHARELTTLLDQDGTLATDVDRARRRHVSLRERPDGSAHGSFDLDPQLATTLKAALAPLTRPKPTLDSSGDELEPDERTLEQRQHDALLEIVQLALRSGGLPSTAGVTTTVVLTMTADAYATGEGTATTSSGHHVPAAAAKQWAGGDARLISVLLDRTRRVEAYSSAHRIFTEKQRLALAARDRGCTFPGCHAPPAHCEVHHLREWADGGPTTLDNAALLCPYHHRHHQPGGWHPVLDGGTIWWTPPPWLHQSEPLRNHTFDRVDDRPTTEPPQFAPS